MIYLSKNIRMGMTDEEAKKFEEMIDKKRDKVRNMTEEDTIEAVKEGIKKLEDEIFIKGAI